MIQAAPDRRHPRRAAIRRWARAHCLPLGEWVVVAAVGAVLALG